MKKSKLVFAIALSIFIANSFISNKASAAPFTPSQLKSEIQEFFNAGAQGYLVWQYSGDQGSGQEFASDPHSFWKSDGEICTALKEASQTAGKWVGVNMWDAGGSTHNQSKIEDHFKHLHDSCGVTVVRVFAKAGEGLGMQKVLNAAASTGIKVIIAIGDYSNPAMGFPSARDENTIVSWYQSGYRDVFLIKVREIKAATINHPALFGYELANEPHCSGHTDALQHYTNWGRTIAQELAGAPNIGYGQIASQAGTYCDSPSSEGFKTSNSVAGITMTSAHYYNPSEKALALASAQQASEIGKMFYIGEAAWGGTATEEEIGFSCQELLVGAANTNCCTANATADVIRNKGIVSSITGALGIVLNVFGLDLGLNDITVTWDNNQTPITDLTPENTDINSRTESFISYLLPSGSFNTKSEEVLQSENGKLPPKIANYAVMFNPELAQSALNAEELAKRCEIITQKEAHFRHTSQEIPGQIDIGVDNIKCSEEMFGFTANNIWGLPGAIPNKSAPVGFASLQEYLGEKMANKRLAYLNFEEQKYLAQNYSENDINKLVFESQRQTQNYVISKDIDYKNKTLPNKIVQTKNTIPTNIVQAANKAELYNNVNACKPPEAQPRQVSCAEPTRKLVIPAREEGQRLQLAQGECTAEEGTTCSTSSEEPLEAAVVTHFYSGWDVKHPTGTTELKYPSDAIKDIQQQSQHVANSNGINLAASYSQQNSAEGSIGFLQSMGSLPFVVAAPGQPGQSENENRISASGRGFLGMYASVAREDLSSELPFNIRTEESTVVGQSVGIGKIQSSAGAKEIIPGGRWSTECATAVSASIDLPPQSSGEAEARKEAIEKIVKKCFTPEDNPELHPSYCGSYSEKLTNNTGNYKVTLQNSPVSSDAIINPNSNLKIKLATRFVDPGLVLNNEMIASVNPGGCDQTALGADSSNKSFIEIWYLPLPFAHKVNDLSFWETYAYKLIPQVDPRPDDANRGETNLEININVNPGYYRINYKPGLCLRPNFQVVGNSRPELTQNGAVFYSESENPKTITTTGYFKLEDSSSIKDTSFCAKMNLAPLSRNPGGNLTQTRHCEIPGGYDSKINEYCGGGGNDCSGTGGCSSFRNLNFKGKDLYEKIFGVPFDIPNGNFACHNVFHGTMYETDCNSVNNTDIATRTPNYFSGDKEEVMRQTAMKHNIPVNLLRAIYQIEGGYDRRNQCVKNAWDAVGAFQITDSTCRGVTTERERRDWNVCNSSPQTSTIAYLTEADDGRCNFGIAAELAVRVLKSKVGQLNINNPTSGGFSESERTKVQRSACGYYGFGGRCIPDEITQNVWGPGISYGDYVFYFMGFCPRLSPDCVGI